MTIKYVITDTAKGNAYLQLSGISLHHASSMGRRQANSGSDLLVLHGHEVYRYDFTMRVLARNVKCPAKMLVKKSIQ